MLRIGVLLLLGYAIIFTNLREDADISVGNIHVRGLANVLLNPGTTCWNTSMGNSCGTVYTTHVRKLPVPCSRIWDTPHLEPYNY